MSAEQRPRPNTRVANSSSPSGNQTRSTANTHKGWNKYVDQDKTHRWLKAADLKAETEGLIIEAQDKSLPTRWYQHNWWVMGVLSTIKKNVENYSNNIPGNINIHELKK